MLSLVKCRLLQDLRRQANLAGDQAHRYAIYHFLSQPTTSQMTLAGDYFDLSPWRLMGAGAPPWSVGCTKMNQKLLLFAGFQVLPALLECMLNDGHERTSVSFLSSKIGKRELYCGLVPSAWDTTPRFHGTSHFILGVT